MAYRQTKTIELVSQNTAVRKFKETREVPVTLRWMDAVRTYFLKCINEEYRDEEKMNNELGLSCNSKAILWTDTILTSMERDKIGVRSMIIRVSIRKRLNSLAMTPGHRNNIEVHQHSLDQYGPWGTNQYEDSLEGVQSPPPPNQTVAGPSSAMGAPVDSSSPIYTLEKIPKIDGDGEEEYRFGQQQNGDTTVDSLSSEDVSEADRTRVGMQNKRPGPAMDEEDANISEKLAVATRIKRKLNQLSFDQIIGIHDSLQVLNEVFDDK